MHRRVIAVATRRLSIPASGSCSLCTPRRFSFSNSLPETPSEPTTVAATRKVARRRQPTEFDDDLDLLGAEELPNQRQRAATIEPFVVRKMTAARADDDDDQEADSHQALDADGASAATNDAPYKRLSRVQSFRQGDEESDETSVLSPHEGALRDGSAVPQQDPLLTPQSIEASTNANEGDDPVAAYLASYSDFLSSDVNAAVDMPIVELVQQVNAYIRATSNPRIVNADEEAHLFPALVKRLDECTIAQLLDIIDNTAWARSTTLRHGQLFKDLVRDRIARDCGTLDAQLLLRCIVVLGMSAGRRKRDLDFFQLLGTQFVENVNNFKHPNDLVRVLSSFARAKIVPPNSFLALVGRRLPVLSKKQPLGSLPAYRALVNLYRMKHDQINPFRFLADRIFEVIDTNLREEKVKLRVAELQKERTREASAEGNNATGATAPSGESTNADGALPLTQLERERRGNLEIRTAAVHGDLIEDLQQAELVRRRFHTITELKPSMFTKLLLVLARFGAPHQLYLRPMIKSVIVPVLPHLSPPTFSRLLRAVAVFKTPDAAIIVPLVDHLITLGPLRVGVHDVLEVLRILASPDVPMMPNFDGFVALCVDLFSSDGVRLRPGDMCAIATDLMLIQQKTEIPLEAVAPLCVLIDSFAERMTFLIQLGVLNLTHAEVLEELCDRMHHPDASGKLSELKRARREVNRSEGGDDDYYMRLDIDVRETFHKAQVVNHWNTFNAYAPLPGVLQVDLKQALTEVSAETILETAHLFEQAYPGKMILPLQRHLSKALLAKYDEEGEEVITADNTIELRPNKETVFTRATLQKFCNMLIVTPLKAVRRSPKVWTHVREKAIALNVEAVAQVATDELLKLTSK